MSQHDDRRPLPSASEQRRTDALRLIARARAAHDTIEVPGRDPTNDTDGDSNDLGRRIVEASADCTFVLTMDGLIQFTNENGRRLLAVDDADQVIGRSWHEFWPHDQRSMLQEAMVAARSGGVGRFAGNPSTVKGNTQWWDVIVSPMRNASGTPIHLLAVSRDMTTVRHDAEAGALLNRELGHRIKNLFALVSGLVTLAARGDTAVQPFATAFRQRMTALSDALNYVLPSQQVTVPRQTAPTLHGLLRVLLRPYESSVQRRFVILGDNPPVGPKATTNLALCVHELVTNAVKYGALANPEGRVSITSRCTADDDCELAWEERGGPVLASHPPETSFGSKLLRRSIKGALGGQVTKLWDREGLTLRLVLPLTPLSQ